MTFEEMDDLLYEQYDVYKADVISALHALSETIDYSPEELIEKLAQALLNRQNTK